MSKSLVLWSLVAFGVILMSAPTLIIIGASFTSGDLVRFPPEGFSLRWYAELLNLTGFQNAFWRSLYAAAVCTIIAVPVGTLAALAMARFRFRLTRTIQLYLLLPFTIPLVVSGIG